MPNTTSRRFFALNAPQQQINAAITSAATSVSVPSFTGWPVLFPFYAAFEIGTASLEIVSVTAIVGGTATITRAARGTAAIAHPLGATMDMVAVDQDYDDANAHSSATYAVHGVAGNVVGDSDIQTLTNKTLGKAKFTGDAGTEAIQSQATSAGGKVFSGRNSGNIEKSYISDVGLASLQGGLNVGSSAQFAVDNLGALISSASVSLTAAGTALAVSHDATVGGNFTVTGGVKAAGLNGVPVSPGIVLYTSNVGNTINKFTVDDTGAVVGSGFTGSSFTGVILPKSYTNEAAAGAPSIGCIVYLTAPTGTGYFAGAFQYTASGWVPLQTAGADSGWTVATLGNSWVSFDAGVTFDIPSYRLKNGIVYLKGLMKSGTSATTVFTLPAGYRPSKSIQFATVASVGGAKIRIDNAGNVSVQSFFASGTNGDVSLNGVQFIAEA